jgi:hypothetical protein
MTPSARMRPSIGGRNLAGKFRSGPLEERLGTRRKVPGAVLNLFRVLEEESMLFRSMEFEGVCF